MWQTKLSIPVNLQTTRNQALDGLRGVAILLVLLPHFGINYYLRQVGLNMESNIGVQLFFVLSGFLITTLLVSEKLTTGSVNIKYFYVRRCLRILPVAYLYLLVLIILNYIFTLNIPAFDFLQSFIFYKNSPLPSSYYTAQYWSLAVEVQFYLVFPALLALNPTRYFWFILSIVIVVPLFAIVSFYTTGLYNSHTSIALLAKLCRYAFWKGPTMILIGSVFAMLIFKYNLDIRWLGKPKYLSIILLLWTLVICSPRFLYHLKYIAEYISAIIFGIIILMSINSDNLLSRILRSPIMVRMGLLSYGIYIWQQLFVGNHAWHPWLKFLSPQPVWVLMLVKFVAISVIATLSFKFEQRFLKLKQKFEPENSAQ
ncbi:acyltransferase [Mucilaginibacter sp. UYP27]